MLLNVQLSVNLVILALILTSMSESARRSRVPVWSELAIACKIKLVLGGKVFAVPILICSELK